MTPAERSEETVPDRKIDPKLLVKLATIGARYIANGAKDFDRWANTGTAQCRFIEAACIPSSPISEHAG